MSKRAEVEAMGYTLGGLTGQIITDPGKFEQSHWSDVLFWNMANEGFSDEEIFDGDTLISVFHIDIPDREAFELLPDVDYVVIWEDSQGFVYSLWLSEDEYQRWLDLIENEESDEE